MIAAGLSLLAALGWGAGDFAGGLSSRRIGAMRAVFYTDWVGTLMLLVVVFFMPESLPTAENFMWALLAGLAGSSGLLILYYALSKGNMGIAASVSALLAAVIPVLVGYFTEGALSGLQWLGFGLALAAIWLVSNSQPSFPKLKALSALGLPFLSGLGFGSYFVLMHQASEASLIWPMIGSRLVGTVLLFIILLIRRQGLTISATNWPIVLINTIFDISGNVFYILAAQVGRSDVAAVISSLYPSVTAFLAWWFLKEKLSAWQLLGVGLALASIVLFTL